MTDRPPYLPNDAFLRSLPFMFEPSEAIRLEAIVFAADTIRMSMNTLRRYANRLGELEDGKATDFNVEMVSSAWTAVDNFHAIRLALRPFSAAHEVVAGFIASYEAATLLRNDMDHLDQKVGNFSKKKNMAPLFGTVSYVYVPPRALIERGPERVFYEWFSTSVCSGRTHGNAAIEVSNPMGKMFDPPVDHFELHAFDRSIDLSQAERDLEPVLNFLDYTVSKSTREQAPQLAEENGITVDDVLSGRPGHMTLQTRFSPGN